LPMPLPLSSANEELPIKIYLCYTKNDDEEHSTIIIRRIIK
jgi:hypothetical protein